ncbi:MAG: type II toxin-antitoxin system PemK/MazF family toxin [Chitinophagales bacterium]
MKTGDIILVPFPFAEQTKRKLRPAAIIALTEDKYKDIIVSAISSVVPQKLSKNEIQIKPSTINKLRTISVLKVDRIVTIKKQDMIAKLGKLNKTELSLFKDKFKKLVD